MVALATERMRVAGLTRDRTSRCDLLVRRATLATRRLRSGRPGELSDLLSVYGVMLATSTSGFKKSVRGRFDGFWPKAEIVNEVKRAA
jgi:hypothetical protein